jgi:hypothetical protein
MSLLIQVMPVSKVINAGRREIPSRASYLAGSTRMQERDKLHNLLFTPDDAGVKGNKRS